MLQEEGVAQYSTTEAGGWTSSHPLDCIDWSSGTGRALLHKADARTLGTAVIMVESCLNRARKNKVVSDVACRSHRCLERSKLPTGNLKNHHGAEQLGHAGRMRIRLATAEGQKSTPRLHRIENATAERDS